jgi:uncharacterized membrane protein YdbT with pleckstrin-like domain
MAFLDQLVSLFFKAVVLLLLLVIGGHLAGRPWPFQLEAVLIGGGWVIAAWANWRSNSLNLTDQRVILTSGVIRRVRMTIPLVNIQSVSTRRSVPGWVLRYCTLEIGVGDGGVARFTFTPKRLLSDDLFAPWR